MELQPIMKKQKTKGKDFISLQKTSGNDQRKPEQLETPLEYPSSPVALLPQSVHETVTETFEKGISCLRNKGGEEDFFLQVIETTPQPFCSAYGDGRIKGQNRAFLDLLGYSEEELRTRTWADIVAPERRDQDCRALAELRRQDRPQLCETVYVRKDGTRVPVEASVHRIASEGGQDFYYCWFVRDITERKKVEGELQKVNEHLSSYVTELEQRNRETELFSEMVSLLQACVTIEEVHSVTGRLARELFAHDSGAMYLLNPARKLLEPVAIWGDGKTSDQGISARECWSLRLGKMYLVDSCTPGMLCSHVKLPLQTASLCIPLMAQGETLGLLHLLFSPTWFSTSGDARERQKRHKQQLAIAVAENIALSLANFKLRDTLYIQSIHDYLTGLFNRRYMAELLEKELHRMARKKQSAGIIIIDVDRFKSFNDRYGHEAGDMVLREFSLFLRKNIREEDFACRYGGDEFVIILPETSLENARQRAEQLRQGVKKLDIQFRGDVLDRVTLSLGVAVYPHHGLTAEMLLRTADAALYRAKAEGRDRVVTL
jgi:diguanylate cyclase (GGDEF)-like protein/PAS domain S-box-containing protein